MVMLNPNIRAIRSPQVSAAELAGWHAKIKALPSAGVFKVEAARDAMAQRALDTLDEWEETLRRISRAMGVA